MKYCVLVVLAVVFIRPVFGQNPESLELSLDVAVFKYDLNVSFVELYYSFSRSNLMYSGIGTGFEGSAVLRAIIRDTESDRDPVIRVWRVPVSVDDTSGMAKKTLCGKVNFTLPHGKYKIALIARDEGNPAMSDSIEIPYEVRAFPGRNPSFSDIQLCTSIQKIEPDSTNIFYKNTLEVVPNPTRLYGSSMPRLMYYSELYDTDLESYVIRTDVISSYGKTMQSRDLRKKGKYPSRVEVGSVNVRSMASGVYTLILSYADTGGTVQTSQSKSFYVYNPDIPFDSIQVVNIAASIAFEFAAMAEDELDMHFAQTRYLSTEEERDMFDELEGAEPKKKFLTTFWSNRDPDRATIRNELYEEYMGRVTVANQRFRTAYRAGWKSDRGRVFLSYGPPDHIERFTSGSDTKPYQTWTYDTIESGVVFIFVDKGGFNDYELVHSTMRTEMNNPNWEQHIRTY